MIVHDPPNTFKIESIWAFVSVDENGNEGLVAAPTAIGTMPLIAADEARLESLKPIATQIAKLTNKKIQLIRMTSRQVVWEHWE